MMMYGAPGGDDRRACRSDVSNRRREAKGCEPDWPKEGEFVQYGHFEWECSRKALCGMRQSMSVQTGEATYPRDRD